MKEQTKFLTKLKLFNWIYCLLFLNSSINLNGRFGVRFLKHINKNGKLSVNYSAQEDIDWNMIRVNYPPTVGVYIVPRLINIFINHYPLDGLHPNLSVHQRAGIYLFLKRCFFLTFQPYEIYVPDRNEMSRLFDERIAPVLYQCTPFSNLYGN